MPFDGIFNLDCKLISLQWLAILLAQTISASPEIPSNGLILGNSYECYE